MNEYQKKIFQKRKEDTLLGMAIIGKSIHEDLTEDDLKELNDYADKSPSVAMAEGMLYRHKLGRKEPKHKGIGSKELEHKENIYDEALRKKVVDESMFAYFAGLLLGESKCVPFSDEIKRVLADNIKKANLSDVFVSKHCN